MITHESNQTIIVRRFPDFGDAALLHKALTSDFWKNLFLKDRLAFWQLAHQFFYWNLAVFGNMTGMLLRYRHGQRTAGFFLYLATVITLLVYNSAEVIHFLKPFGFLIAPFLPFFNDTETLWCWMTEDIHSLPLLVFTAAYTVVGFVRCLFIIAGRGNPDLTKRGESYLYRFVFKPMGLKKEFVVQGIIEPCLLGVAAWICAAFFHDYVFAFVLGASAFSLFLPEVIDYADEQKHRVHLRNTGGSF